MIKKVLSMDFNNKSISVKEHFHIIGTSLLGFPSITPNILYLIGLLFDKVQTNVKDFSFLYQIMKNNFSFKTDNISEALSNINLKK